MLNSWLKVGLAAASLMLLFTGGVVLALGAGTLLAGGLQLAFASSITGTWDIYLFDARTGLVAQVTHGTNHHRYPRWSPDGARIAFDADRSRRFDVYIMHADGTNAINAAPTGEYVWEFAIPNWSPDGERIVFQGAHHPDEYYRPYIRHLNATSLRPPPGREIPPLDIDLDGHVIHPAWSPDGARLVVTATEDEETWSLYVLELDDDRVTGDPVRITGDGLNAYFPAWSPDGERIAFSGVREDENDDVYIVDADGGNLRNMTVFEAASDWQPTWLPDGSGIIFASDRDGDYDLYTLDLENGVAWRLLRFSGDVWAPAVRPR